MQAEKQSLSKTPQKTPLGAIPRSQETPRVQENHSFIPKVGIPQNSKLPPGQIPQPSNKMKLDTKPNQKPSLVVTPLSRTPLPKTQTKQPISQQSQHRSVKNFNHPQPQFRAIPRSPPSLAASKTLMPQRKFCLTGKSAC